MGHVLLHTLPGRAIVVGLAARIATYLVELARGSVPTSLGVLNMLAGAAVAAGASYFVYQLLVIAKRRLLWRVRQKLILSYIFVGFVPAILIAAFFLLSGFLLFYNFSSFLVQSRLRSLGDRAKFVAETTAIEIQGADGRDVAGILDRKRAAAASEYPGLSLVVVPADRTCQETSAGGAGARPKVEVIAAGSWSHVAPPTSVPSWIDCRGFAGVLAYSMRPDATLAGLDASASTDSHIVVRAAAFAAMPHPDFAVIVDLPIDDQVTQQVRRETGVEILDGARVEPGQAVRPLEAREPVQKPSGGRSATGILGGLPTLLEYRDWRSGESGTLTIVTQLRVAEIYDHISSVPGLAGPDLGRGFLLAIFIIGGLFLIIQAVALAMGLALAKSITGSVHALFAGTERVSRGDFRHRIDVGAQDQLGALSISFNDMTRNIEGLMAENAEKKRMEEELRIARAIQMSLLPQGPLVMPGLSVTALSVPAREVGGDYYDFFRLGERRLGLLIADVSGKGTSAALYMAELKGLMLSLTKIHTSPRDLMLAADRIIAANLDARSFITMTYAVVDLDARTMTYARAGHTPLMYVPGPATLLERRVQVMAPDGLVLGLNIDNGETFERLLVEETIDLHSGDLALFFTDGITEAMNEADEDFGEPRLARFVETHAHLPSLELRERVLLEIKAFVGAAPQHDDMTMILLKVEELGAPAAIDASTAEFVEI